MGSCASTSATTPEKVNANDIPVESKDEKVVDRHAGLPSKAFTVLFDGAHTHHGFHPKPVSDDLLKAIYDNFKWGPTAFNCTPLRVVYVKSKEGKEKLCQGLMEGNIGQTKQAPVTAILAYSTDFVEKFKITSPYYDAASLFTANPSWVEPTAKLNASLQVGYFILAARGVGLDCGPMTGFSNDKIDELFFQGTSWKSLVLVNLGYGDETKLYPRAPRLEYQDAVKFE